MVIRKSMHIPCTDCIMENILLYQEKEDGVAEINAYQSTSSTNKCKKKGWFKIEINTWLLRASIEVFIKSGIQHWFRRTSSTTSSTSTQFFNIRSRKPAHLPFFAFNLYNNYRYQLLQVLHHLINKQIMSEVNYVKKSLD